MIHSLPLPRLTATITPPVQAQQLGDVRVTFDARPADPRAARSRAGEDGQKQRRARGVDRRACHCTSCGLAGHNARSQFCPARSAP